MKRLSLLWIITSFFMACTVSCEKPVVTTDEETDSDDLISLRINISTYEQIAFSSAPGKRQVNRKASEVSSRINCAIYKDGTRVKSINQTASEGDFGTLTLQAEAGTYQLVVIAHNGTGNATMTDLKNIKFPNNKLTDTFAYYTVVDLKEDTSLDIVLERVVAMFRLVVTDNTPEEVRQMRFYYTGGSSTLDAETGFGCVDSRQTELRTVETTAYNGSSVYEVYTFPHTSPDELKMTVSALDADEAVTHERTFEDVPVDVRQITQYKGEFFGESADDGRGKLMLSVNDTWKQEDWTF